MKDHPRAKRLAVLLSGRGSNFLAIADSIAAGKLAAEIALVISNQAGAPGLQSARKLGLNAMLLPSRGIAREQYDRQLAAEMEKSKIDLICLAGYMRKLTPEFVRRFPLRILNIHPSLLPAFPGLHVHQTAIDHGVKFSGCTVHFVDEGLDSGPIVQQAAVPVLDDDTADMLSARILKEEHRVYSEAIALVLSGKWKLDGRRVLASPKGT